MESTCEHLNLQRLRRTLWMRLFWKRRYYRCADCQAHFFVDKDAVVGTHLMRAPGLEASMRKHDRLHG